MIRHWNHRYLILYYCFFKEFLKKLNSRSWLRAHESEAAAKVKGSSATREQGKGASKPSEESHAPSTPWVSVGGIIDLAELPADPLSIRSVPSYLCLTKITLLTFSPLNNYNFVSSLRKLFSWKNFFSRY